MRDYIDKIKQLFDMMKARPERQDELDLMLIELLKQITRDNKCLGILHSRPSNDSFILSVVPLKYELITNTKNVPTGYYIDMDLNAIQRRKELGGLSSSELTAWLIHELAHNILTSTTRLRIQMLVLSATGENNRNSYPKVFRSDISSYFWWDIHNRTYKEMVTEAGIKYEADRLLLELGINDDWNSALSKYIDGIGGNSFHVSEEYNDRLDKAAVKMLNELIRENFTNRKMAYSTDIARMGRIKKYVSQNKTSTLLTKMLNLEENPMSSLPTDEVKSFVVFDDSLLNHNIKQYDDEPEALNESILPTFFNYNHMLRSIDKVRFEMEDIRTIDDKISIMFEIRDYLEKVEREMKRKPNDENLKDLKAALELMLVDLKKLKIKQREFGVWVQGTMPVGYEG
jgi:hypothetical protein